MGIRMLRCIMLNIIVINGLMGKVITFSQLGEYGRIGNQLWEIAALLGLAHDYGYKAIIPETWEYREDFNIPAEFFSLITPQEQIKETQHGFIPGFLDDAKADIVDLVGCFQSYLYWRNIKDDIKKWLRPRQYFEANDWMVAVHIRRGDYVNNKSYAQYGVDWYTAAMNKYFSDPRYVFNIVSDDMKFVREHFKGDRYITDTRTVVEDFTNIVATKHHILSGSSFSFWGAFLSRGDGITVRPPRTHAGKLANLDESTSWLPGWTVFNNDQEVALVCYANDAYKELQNRLVQ